MADETVQQGNGAREQRARQWIRQLTEIPERCASTAAERAAAERVGEWMRELGVRDVALHPLAARPRAGVTLALHAGLAALGCWWGGFFGALLAVVVAWSFWREYHHHELVLSRLVPTPESVNVIGQAGAESPARRLILSAHIDAAQAGFLFSKPLADLLARSAHATSDRRRPPTGALALPEALILAGAILAVGAWLGAHGILFGLAKLIATVGLLVVAGLAAQWAAARATPGANDNASAVAAMLLSAERLLPSLPPDVQLWVVGTGAEEVGSVGMHAFVDERSAWPDDATYFLNFECVGGGALHYICSEGVLGKSRYPPLMTELARRLAAGGAFGEVTPTDLMAGTDGHVPATHGYPTLSLISLEANGVPRNYHRPEDIVDALDMSMVVRAADFGTAVATAALGGAAGPIRA